MEDQTPKYLKALIVVRDTAIRRVGELMKISGEANGTLAYHLDENTAAQISRKCDADDAFGGSNRRTDKPQMERQRSIWMKTPLHKSAAKRGAIPTVRARWWLKLKGPAGYVAERARISSGHHQRRYEKMSTEQIPKTQSEICSGRRHIAPGRETVSGCLDCAGDCGVGPSKGVPS